MDLEQNLHGQQQLELCGNCATFGISTVRVRVSNIRYSCATIGLVFDRVSLENTRFSPRSLNMNSIILDSMQQQKFEVHTPFRFEAVDTGTKTVRELATYPSSLEYISSAHANTPQKRGGGH